MDIDKRDHVAAAAQRLGDELKALRDGFVDGDVLRYVRVFPGADHKYTYVAVKIDGQWWLSGRREGWTTWESLREIFASGQVTELRVASEWTEVPLS